MTLKDNFYYVKYFGVRLTFFKTLNKMVTKSRGKLAWKIHDKNNDMIEQYLKSVCNNTYKNALSDGGTSNMNGIVMRNTVASNYIKKNNVIWTIWWQGEKNAPEIVKACISNMRKFSNEHPVIVLDESNYMDYISLPEIILSRYNAGMADNEELNNCVLDKTKLSDIVRCLLLYQYGGVWVDATIMFTDVIPETFFTSKWSTLGQDNNWYIGRGKWSTFFMGCQAGNPLMKFVYQMHLEYWYKKKYYVNYLLIDFMIDIAYKEIPGIADLMNNDNTKNKKVLTINRRYMEKVDNREIDEFLQEQHFHKLSWKWWGRDEKTPVFLYTNNGDLTWFGYLYQKYVDESK